MRAVHMQTLSDSGCCLAVDDSGLLLKVTSSEDNFPL